MTRVTKRRITREMDAFVFERSVNRPVIVTLEPHGVIAVRLKGTRRTYTMTADRVYNAAMRAAVFRQAMEAAKTRKFKAKRSRV